MKNKIYNNLNIENLVKTNWFNQFDKNQQKEIRIGLEKKINIFIYAKLEFDWLQMREIRVGLENKLEVLIYAKKYFDYSQMTILRLGL